MAMCSKCALVHEHMSRHHFRISTSILALKLLKYLNIKLKSYPCSAKWPHDYDHPKQTNSLELKLVFSSITCLLSSDRDYHKSYG